MNGKITVPHVEKLTARQNEILQYIASGRTHEEIAESLGLSHQTVKHHSHAINLRLGVKNSIQAIIAARGK